MWDPISQAIQEGPISTRELDKLRTSVIAEARTADQTVRYEEFIELDTELFMIGSMLIDALKNSNYLAGNLKIKAYDSILNTEVVSFLIGFMFAPLLAKRAYFRWGGVAFVGFNRLSTKSDGNEIDVPITIAKVITAVNTAVAEKLAEQIGTRKLSAVFKAKAFSVEQIGFRELMTFYCTLYAKGADWFNVLTHLINKCQKNAYYLRAMLQALMNNLREEILSNRDRESIKKLVALIQTKRVFQKTQPGARSVNKMLSQMEKNSFFSKISTR